MDNYNIDERVLNDGFTPEEIERAIEFGLKEYGNDFSIVYLNHGKLGYETWHPFFEERNISEQSNPIRQPEISGIKPLVELKIEK
jgi:hypothetical protein